MYSRYWGDDDTDFTGNEMNYIEKDDINHSFYHVLETKIKEVPSELLFYFVSSISQVINSLPTMLLIPEELHPTYLHKTPSTCKYLLSCRGEEFL